MPAALSVGVSYADYQKMTVGEIISVIDFAAEKMRNEMQNRERNAAFIAYYSGVFSRVKSLPRSLQAAFPSLFGRTDDGQIKADNTDESERAMEAWFARFNSGRR